MLAVLAIKVSRFELTTMALFSGPYALAAIIEAVQAVRPPLIRRLCTNPAPIHIALSARQIKRTSSAIIEHEGRELLSEALENTPPDTLNHVYEIALFAIACYYTIHLMHRLFQMQQTR